MVGPKDGGDLSCAEEEVAATAVEARRGRGSLESFDWFYTRVRVRFLRRAMGTHDVR